MERRGRQKLNEKDSRAWKKNRWNLKISHGLKEKLAGLEKELQESIRLEETEKVSRLEKEVNLLQGQEQSRRETGTAGE